MLSLHDGEPFATGSQPYLFRPATTSDSCKRIIIEVEIQGHRTHAMLDTGAPYVICNPVMAGLLGLDPAAALEPKNLLIRGTTIRGWLYRLNLKLRAEEGDELIIDATAFVPSAAEAQWPGLPAVVGLEGCLERARFAFDTSNDTFYFGSHP